MSAQRRCGTAHSAPRSRARTALVGAWLVLAVPAQDAEAPAPLETAIAKLLDHPDPVVRGEAALCLAIDARPESSAGIRQTARDTALGARMRGLIALAVAELPGAEVELARVLDDAEPDAPEAWAAAFALARLPDSRPNPALDAITARIDGGSRKRHRDLVRALLAGLADSPHPSRRLMVRGILEEFRGRDPDVEALAILALARMPALTSEDVADALASRDARVRRVVLAEIAAGRYTPTADETARIRRMVERDRDALVRATALDALVAQRSTAAAEVIDDAVQAKPPAIAAAGLRAALTLGSLDARDNLAEMVERETDRTRRAALLGSWTGAVPKTLLDRAFRDACDSRNSIAHRIAAARIVAEAGQARIVPVLRGLAEAADSSDQLTAVYEALDLLGDDRDLPPLPPAGHRLEALLRAERAGALDTCRQWLEDERVAPATKADLLSALRRVHGQSAPDAVVAALPAELRAIVR